MSVSDYVRSSTKYTPHQAGESAFYAGSRLLQPLSDSSGLPIDQLNIVVSMAISLVLSVFFHIFMGRVNTTLRHLFEIVCGVIVCHFCFGNQIIWVLLEATITYLIIRFAPPKSNHLVVFIFCYTYLSAAHILRQIYDYGGYTIDVHLPMMILTQRMTALAFSIHDGRNKKLETLPHDQKFLAIQRFPSLLEFYSYAFYFQGIICGPFVHYADYLSFVEDRNWTRFSMPSVSAANTEEQPGFFGNQARPKGEIGIVRVQVLHPPKDERPPALPLSRRQLFNSCMTNGLKSLGITIICGILQVAVSPLFPISKMTDPEFQAKNPFWYKQLFVMMFIFGTKQRYFFIWKFVDSVNILSGLSYSGISEKGKAQWRLTDEIDILEFELGTRFAVHLNTWHKTTAIWLRFMIYDRASWHPTVLTFATSAIWHGFYPGYYVSALTAAIFLQAVRVVRSTLLPLCELRRSTRALYEISAFILIRFASGYMVLPFLVMTLKESIGIYRMLYFWPHALAIMAMIFLPFIRRYLPESMRHKKVYGRARSNKQTTKEDDSVKAPLNMTNGNLDSLCNDSDADPMKRKTE